MNRSNETHDPRLASWVEVANAPGADFPVQNLPFAVFRRRGSSEAFRGGVAIGDQVLDLAAAHRAGAFSGEAAGAAASCSAPSLNAFMAMGPRAWSSLRLALSRGLRAGSPQEQRLRGCLVPQGEAQFAVPAQIGDFTDFYASVHHGCGSASSSAPTTRGCRTTSGCRAGRSARRLRRVPGDGAARHTCIRSRSGSGGTMRAFRGSRPR
jgi:fumarylacetoacetase